MPLFETRQDSSDEPSHIGLSVPKRTSVLFLSILTISGGAFLIFIALLLGAVGGSWSIGGLGSSSGFHPWLDTAVFVVSAGLLILGLPITIVGLFAAVKVLLKGFNEQASPGSSRSRLRELPGEDAAAPSQSTNRVTVLIAELSIAVVVTIVFFLLIDWGVRLLLPEYRSALESKFPVEVTRRPTPYTMFTGLPEGQIQSESLNRMGYRGEAPPALKESGEFRIFMLGGSTVFNGEPPIAALLQERFRETDFLKVSVYNFGVLSSVSGMELSRIVHEIADLEPDLIIMYNGANDLTHPYFWDPRPGYPFNFIVYENHPLLESDIRSYPTLPLLAYGSHILRMIGSRYFLDRFVPQEQERQKAGYASDQWRGEIAKKYVGNLSKAIRVSSALGSELLAFFQPMLFFRDQLTEEERALGYEPELGAHCNDMRDQFRGQVELLPDELGSRILDLSDVYDEYPSPVFVDFIHTTQESKSLIVEVIYQHMVERSGRWLDGGPGSIPGEPAQATD